MQRRALISQSQACKTLKQLTETLQGVTLRAETENLWSAQPLTGAAGGASTGTSSCTAKKHTRTAIRLIQRQERNMFKHLVLLLRIHCAVTKIGF